LSNRVQRQARSGGLSPLSPAIEQPLKDLLSVSVLDDNFENKVDKKSLALLLATAPGTDLHCKHKQDVADERFRLCTMSSSSPQSGSSGPYPVCEMVQRHYNGDELSFRTEVIATAFERAHHGKQVEPVRYGVMGAHSVVTGALPDTRDADTVRITKTQGNIGHNTEVWTFSEYDAANKSPHHFPCDFRKSVDHIVLYGPRGLRSMQLDDHFLIGAADPDDSYYVTRYGGNFLTKVCRLFDIPTMQNVWLPYDKDGCVDAWFNLDHAAVLSDLTTEVVHHPSTVHLSADGHSRFAVVIVPTEVACLGTLALKFYYVP
jgi:hypothetical protein